MFVRFEPPPPRRHEATTDTQILVIALVLDGRCRNPSPAKPDHIRRLKEIAQEIRTLGTSLTLVPALLHLPGDSCWLLQTFFCPFPPLLLSNDFIPQAGAAPFRHIRTLSSLSCMRTLVCETIVQILTPRPRNSVALNCPGTDPRALFRRSIRQGRPSQARPFERGGSPLLPVESHSLDSFLSSAISCFDLQLLQCLVLPASVHLCVADHRITCV